MTSSRSSAFEPARRLAVAAALITTMAWALASPAIADGVGSPVRAGDAVLVDPINQSKELTHGGSATKFSLRLPAGATCPGDSENDQWRVQSFIIPAADDPGSLRYGVIGPQGPKQFALYQVNTRPFTDTFTQPNSAPGQAGAIPAIAELSFAVFPPGTLPDGVYRVGIACTYFRETAKFWDAEIVVGASSNDDPAHLTWRLTTAPPMTAAESDGSSRWVFLAVGVVLVGGAVAVVLGRIRRRPAERTDARFSKEPQ